MTPAPGDRRDAAPFGEAGPRSGSALADGGDPAIRRLDDWDAGRLRALATEYDIPLYVIDLDRVAANHDRLRAAFPDARVQYAMKANAGRAVLDRLNAIDGRVECASAGEVHRALDAGFPAGRIHYTAVNPPAADLDAVAAIACANERDDLSVSAGAADTVDRLATRGFSGPVWLRVTPGLGAGHHVKVRTGSDPTFGVPVDRAAAVAGEAIDRGLDLCGVHAHAGSGFGADDVDRYRSFLDTVADAARAVADAVESLDSVDVGGGFGVPYREEEPPLDLDRFARAANDALGPVLDDLGATLVIEPGRYVVADAGVLLTRVNTVKPTDGTTVVGVDAGMTTLLRPALYDAYHAIRSLAPDAGERPERSVTVAGPVCESADVLARDRDLPHPERGDLLAVGNAGAYGIEMANQYNSRPRPAVVALADGEASLTRRPESISDVVSAEVATTQAASDAEVRSDGESVAEPRSDGDGVGEPRSDGNGDATSGGDDP